jgi:peptide/nickel transport system substrate-binding protein
MTLETPGLDPTAGAASAISEVVLYNVFETLTNIRPDGSVGPLLAQSWTVTPDSKTWSFKRVPGVKFHNGEAFNAETVRFSLERVIFRFISEAAAPVAALLAGDVAVGRVRPECV